MAKQKKAGGTSVGLIITLIFFVLTTFVGGFFAYTIYNDQEQFVKEAEKAKKDKAVAEQQLRVEQTKTVVYRIALGTDDGNDRLRLVAGMLDEESRLAIRKEHEMLADKFRPPLLPNADDFEWKLIAMDPTTIRASKTGTEYGAAEAMADRDVAPKRLLPAVVKEYKDKADAATAAKVAALAEAKAFKKQVEGVTSDRGANKAEFDKQIETIKADVTKTNTAANLAFDDLKKTTIAKNNGDVAKLAKLAQERDLLEQDKEVQAKKFKEASDKLAKYDAQQSLTQSAASGPDLIAQDEKKGEILVKEGNFTRVPIPTPGRFPTIEGGPVEARGTFVTINIGSAQKLRTGVTFAVLPAAASWRSFEEKERLIKGQIEVVEILGPYTAKAKVIDEKEPIRNPMQAKDQLFNLTWNPTEEIRVAFAGIIDLDGDGIDNNEDFLRLLERQGVIVDEYLKLKPLEFVKRDQRGMSLRTKFLIIAPDPRLEEFKAGAETPQSRQIAAVLRDMSDMRSRAKELGIQLIEARKFMAMIGIKPPTNPAPPAYGAAVYVDPTAAPPKKDPQ